MFKELYKENKLLINLFITISTIAFIVMVLFIISYFQQTNKSTEITNRKINNCYNEIASYNVDDLSYDEVLELIKEKRKERGLE